MAAPLTTPTPSTRPTPLSTTPLPDSQTKLTLKSPNATAAADLIRNLDKALHSAHASSLTAKDDAERARRNARAAGEVARRYGGKTFKKKGDAGASPGEGGEQRSLLEMKRERRSRAKMAAEARQRREYEMSGGGVTSNVWGGGDWSASSSSGALNHDSGAENNSVGGAYDVNQNQDGARVQLFRADAAYSGTGATQYNYESPDQMKTAITNKEDEVQVVSDPTNVTTTTADVVNNEPDDINNQDHGPSNDTMSATDGTVSTMEFEDALDSHSVENARSQDDFQGGEQPAATGTEAVNNNASYYDQQSQYYNQQQYQNGSYYNQSTDQQNQYYYNQDGSQSYSTTTEQNNNWNMKAASTPTAANKSASLVAATPTATANNQSIEASTAEDVLTLSLELERTRSQLATTTHHLTTSQSHISTLQSHNAHLQSELNRLQSELESVREHCESEIQSYSSKFNVQLTRANAAEEDANNALEYANNATEAKEECEKWLGVSMEELKLWKGRCADLERELAASKSEQVLEEDEPKKFVRFADEPPTSPVISEDGGFRYQSPLGQQQSHGVVPPPPVSTPSETLSNRDLSTPKTTPNKSSIASGLAFLHRSSPGFSPQQKSEVQDLLKRAAETRRILKERAGTPIKQPPSLALVALPRNASNGSLSVLNEDGFASRQGAACRSVGKAIRDSGYRLKLDGKWWRALTIEGGEPVIEGVAELESMVREYCGSVEGKIGSQNERIEELLAFCDHLEKELLNGK